MISLFHDFEERKEGEEEKRSNKRVINASELNEKRWVSHFKKNFDSSTTRKLYHSKLKRLLEWLTSIYAPFDSKNVSEYY